MPRLSLAVGAGKAMALESQEEELGVGLTNGGGDMSNGDDVDIHQDDSCDYVDEDEDEEFSFVDDGYENGVPSSFTAKL